MIFGKTEYDIVKLAVEFQSEMTDGVVQYDYKSDELFGAGFTTGTVENPANKVIEVFRISQGENPIVFINDEECAGCDRYCKGISHDELRESDECIECCIDAYVDDGFDDDFEDFQDGIEEQVRDVLSDYLSETIRKLNEIRVAISDIHAPHDFWKVRQDDWETRVLDSYIDDAMENGFCPEYCSEFDILDAEVQHIIDSCEFSENEYVQKAGVLVEARRLDEALKVLQ